MAVKLSEAYGTDLVMQALGFVEEIDELTGEIEVVTMRDLPEKIT
jgi:hypothetical protein